MGTAFVPVAVPREWRGPCSERLVGVDLLHFKLSYIRIPMLHYVMLYFWWGCIWDWSLSFTRQRELEWDELSGILANTLFRVVGSDKTFALSAPAAYEETVLVCKSCYGLLMTSIGGEASELWWGMKAEPSVIFPGSGPPPPPPGGGFSSYRLGVNISGSGTAEGGKRQIVTFWCWNGTPLRTSTTKWSLYYVPLIWHLLGIEQTLNDALFSTS